MVMNTRIMWKQGRLIAMFLVPLLLSLQTWAQDNGQLRGVVMSDEGEKLQGTTVGLYSLTDSLIDTKSSDDQGTFHFTKLPRGVTYKVTVSMMGYQRSTQEITMNATGTNSALIRLAPVAEG